MPPSAVFWLSTIGNSCLFNTAEKAARISEGLRACQSSISIASRKRNLRRARQRLRDNRPTTPRNLIEDIAFALATIRLVSVMGMHFVPVASTCLDGRPNIPIRNSVADADIHLTKFFILTANDYQYLICLSSRMGHISSTRTRPACGRSNIFLARIA